MLKKIIKNFGFFSKDGNSNRTVTSGTANSGTATVESGTKEETASKVMVLKN